jgi:hypothetical protein
MLIAEIIIAHDQSETIIRNDSAVLNNLPYAFSHLRKNDSSWPTSWADEISSPTTVEPYFSFIYFLFLKLIGYKNILFNVEHLLFKK